MATFRTRDRMEALRFVRSLVERGYTKAPRRTSGGEIERHSFRTGRRDGYLTVVYWEPAEEPAPYYDVPQPVKAKRAAGRVCSTPGCDRPHHALGLCAKCVHRYYYNTKPEWRAKEMARCAENRRKRQERKEEAA